MNVFNVSSIYDSGELKWNEQATTRVQKRGDIEKNSIFMPIRVSEKAKEQRIVVWERHQLQDFALSEFYDLAVRGEC